MYIAKEVTLPNNGVVVTCHRLGTTQLGTVEAKVWVEHCVSPEAPAFVFTESLAVPIVNLAGPSQADIAAALVAPGGPLEGGTIVDEPIGTLDQAKVLARQAVLAARDRAEFGGCETAFGRVDTKAESQRKAGGAVQMAMIAQAASAPFTIGWTMADNTTIALDADGMIDVGLAIGQHVNACHGHGLGLKDLIDAAETVEDIAAINIKTGWPGAEVEP